MLTKVFIISVVCVLLATAITAEKNVVLQIEDTSDNINGNGTIRGKRTIGVVLRNVADLFGYDVQKRPTVIPPSMAPAPAAPAPAAPAAAPAAPAAPAAQPGMMMGGDIMMAPVAMVNRQQPARVPLLPPAPPLPVLPPPVTFPPILQEQVRKTFNINFNWNKAVGSAQPVAPAAKPPAAPAQPATPAPPQPASVPEGPISSGPKRPVTKAQLYSSYEYLYPPLGSAPPAPKYVKKKYNYKYGPVKTVTNYNDEPEPSHEQVSNEKESAEDNYDDYNTFVAHEDGTPEEGKKEQYKNNVRNFWKNNHWALQDNGYKYIAPEPQPQQQQQQQNFQQDYPKEILTVKESNYYNPLQPLKKVKFQDYYVTQAAQPKKPPPPQPLPTQDISQFKKYYVPSSVPKQDAAKQTPDNQQITQQDLKNIVQQLVQLTQQAKQQQNIAAAATPTTTTQPTLSKYEEYAIPASHEYRDYSVPSSKEYHIPTSEEYGLPPSSKEYGLPSKEEELTSKEEEAPSSPNKKKLEKEKALVKKKEFNNAYKEEKREPTVVEHDYNILNTVTGNEIPYDERKFEEFKHKHGYVAPEDAELPKPDSGEVKEEEEQKEGDKEAVDDGYANIRKPQGKPTEENIETNGDAKANKVVNVKEPIYDSYNDYEEQNDAPALPPQLQIADGNAEEDEEYEDDEEETQNVAEEDDDDDEEEQQEAPQAYYYPAGKTAEKETEEESRINENVKKIISVEAKPVETDVVPTPTYQYFTFRNRRILSFDDVDDSATNQKTAQTTVIPDYEDFSYRPGSTLLRAEKEKAIRDKKREEGVEVDEEEEERETRFQRYKPSPFVTEKIPDFEEVKKAIKKTGRKERSKPKKRSSKKRRERPSQYHHELVVAATTPEQQYTEANIFTFAPTDPILDRTERDVEETQEEVKTQRPSGNKKKDKKYVELSEFLERYDDFDYLRELDRLKAAAADSSEEKEKEKPAEGAESKKKENSEEAESKRKVYSSPYEHYKKSGKDGAESRRSSYSSPYDYSAKKGKKDEESESKQNVYGTGKKEQNEKPEEADSDDGIILSSAWDGYLRAKKAKSDAAESKRKSYSSPFDYSSSKKSKKEKNNEEESESSPYEYSSTKSRKQHADDEAESRRNFYSSPGFQQSKKGKKGKSGDDEESGPKSSSYLTTFDYTSKKPKKEKSDDDDEEEEEEEESQPKQTSYSTSYDYSSKKPKKNKSDDEESDSKPYEYSSKKDKKAKSDDEESDSKRNIYSSPFDSPKKAAKKPKSNERNVYSSPWDSLTNGKKVDEKPEPKRKTYSWEDTDEKEKTTEGAESKQKEHLSIWNDPKQDPQKPHVREIRSKNSKKQKKEEEDDDEEEETTTEAGKFFDNYQIFKDFFNTKSDSHEDDEEEEESEEETKKENSELGYPGFAKAYEQFDYTKKPDFLAQTTTTPTPKEDNKEKKGSSSENHDRYDYYHQPFEQEEKADGDKEKEPQEAQEKKKVDNPYSIPTIFDISHYTNPEIPEIPDFILEEERREEELAKIKQAMEQMKPTIRKVKKPRKRPGGPKPVIPAAKIVPITVATTKPKPAINPAYKPIEDAGTQKVELYSGLQPNQLHELSKVDKTQPLTIPFDYDYSGTEVVQRVARRRRRRDAPTNQELELFTYLPASYNADFSYVIPEPAAQTNYEQYEKKEHTDEPLSQKAKVVTTEVGKLKGHVDVTAF